MKVGGEKSHKYKEYIFPPPKKSCGFSNLQAKDLHEITFYLVKLGSFLGKVVFIFNLFLHSTHRIYRNKYKLYSLSLG